MLKALFKVFGLDNLLMLILALFVVLYFAPLAEAGCKGGGGGLFSRLFPGRAARVEARAERVSARHGYSQGGGQSVEYSMASETQTLPMPTAVGTPTFAGTMAGDSVTFTVPVATLQQGHSWSIVKSASGTWEMVTAGKIPSGSGNRVETSPACIMAPPGYHRHVTSSGVIVQHHDSNHGNAAAHVGVPYPWPKYYGPVRSYRMQSCPSGGCPQ